MSAAYPQLQIQSMIVSRFARSGAPPGRTWNLRSSNVGFNNVRRTEFNRLGMSKGTGCCGYPVVCVYVRVCLKNGQLPSNLWHVEWGFN